MDPYCTATLKAQPALITHFGDDELAAISFERSASFMAMMELEMEEVREFVLVRFIIHRTPTASISRFLFVV